MASDRRCVQISEQVQIRRIQTFRKGVRWIIMQMTDKGYWFPYLKPPTYKAQVKPSVPTFQSPSHAETFAKRHRLTG